MPRWGGPVAAGLRLLPSRRQYYRDLCVRACARGWVEGSCESWAPYGVEGEAWRAMRGFAGAAWWAEIRYADRAVAEGRAADYKAGEGWVRGRMQRVSPRIWCAALRGGAPFAEPSDGRSPRIRGPTRGSKVPRRPAATTATITIAGSRTHAVRRDTMRDKSTTSEAA